MRLIHAGGETFSVDEYEARPELFVEQLLRAKSVDGFALCACMQPFPKLVVRRIKRRAGSLFVLATWPLHGGLHAVDCRFHRADGGSSGGSDVRIPAVVENEDGFTVRVGFPLKRLSVGGPIDPSSVRPEGRQQAVNPKRAELGLLGLLYYLWESAGLARFSVDGSQRNWGEVFARLTNVVGQGMVGKNPLPDQLYLVPPFHAELKGRIDQSWEAFVADKSPTDKSVPLFLVLGEVRSVSESAYSLSTQLRHTKQPLYVDRKLGIALARRYPSEEAELCAAVPQGRVVGLYLVERSAKGNLNVVNAALMLCSKDYIPCDSGHEVRLANQLALEGHTFEKPMFVDQTTNLLPDFIDHSSGSPVHIEVWGMQTPTYVRRKHEKKRVYSSMGLLLWEWDAIQFPDLPPLP